MATRITIKALESLANRLNKVVNGGPMVPYSERGDGSYSATIGCYHIIQAYDGYALHRIENEAGGVSDVFSKGRVPARVLYDCMHAFLEGFAARERI